MKVEELVDIVKEEYIYVYYKGLKLQLDDSNILFYNPELREKEIKFIRIESNQRAIAIYVCE